MSVKTVKKIDERGDLQRTAKRDRFDITEEEQASARNLLAYFEYSFYFLGEM